MKSQFYEYAENEPMYLKINQTNQKILLTNNSITLKSHQPKNKVIYPSSIEQRIESNNPAKIRMRIDEVQKRLDKIASRQEFNSSSTNKYHYASREKPYIKSCEQCKAHKQEQGIMKERIICLQEMINQTKQDYIKMENKYLNKQNQLIKLAVATDEISKQNAQLKSNNHRLKEQLGQKDAQHFRLSSQNNQLESNLKSQHEVAQYFNYYLRRLIDQTKLILNWHYLLDKVSINEFHTNAFLVKEQITSRKFDFQIALKQAEQCERSLLDPQENEENIYGHQKLAHSLKRQSKQNFMKYINTSMMDNRTNKGSGLYSSQMLNNYNTVERCQNKQNFNSINNPTPFSHIKSFMSNVGHETDFICSSFKREEWVHESYLRALLTQAKAIENYNHRANQNSDETFANVDTKLIKI